VTVGRKGEAVEAIAIEIEVSSTALLLSGSITNRTEGSLLLGGLNEQNISVNPVDHRAMVKRWLY